MKHRAIDDADAAIGRTAAACVEIEVESANTAVRVKADRIGNREIMPFARHRHVGVAVEPEFAGPAGDTRGERGERCPLGRLRLFAAETAAHAAHPTGHKRIRHAEHARSYMLHLTRMLGRGVDQNRAVLARDSERDLAFQIKMLLPADVKLSARAQRRRGDRVGGIAVDEGVIGHHDFARGPALLDRHIRGFGVDLHLGAQHGAARGIA